MRRDPPQQCMSPPPEQQQQAAPAPQAAEEPSDAPPGADPPGAGHSGEGPEVPNHATGKTLPTHEGCEAFGCREEAPGGVYMHFCHPIAPIVWQEWPWPDFPKRVTPNKAAEAAKEELLGPAVPGPSHAAHPGANQQIARPLYRHVDSA